jgi:hypothetical protein
MENSRKCNRKKVKQSLPTNAQERNMYGDSTGSRFNVTRMRAAELHSLEKSGKMKAE